MLSFIEGSAVERYELGPVGVYDARSALGIDRQQITEHSICFHHQDVFTEDIVDGKVGRNLWRQGSVGFIPAGVELRSMPDNPYHESGVRFRKGVLAKACEGEIDLNVVDFRFADISGPAIYPLAQTMVHLAQSGGFEQWPMLIETAALSLMVAVIQKLAPASSKAFRFVRHALSSERKRRVFEYIEANLHRRISLTELADVAALSQWHFHRQFHRAVGVTPIQYLASRRLHRAKILLRSSNTPLAVVALDCGFRSQSAFTAFFSSEVGVTPRAYRYGEG